MKAAQCLRTQSMWLKHDGASKGFVEVVVHNDAGLDDRRPHGVELIEVAMIL